MHHWVDGGETSVDNAVLLCRRHHRVLHEGGCRIRRDYQGEYYFVRADGRVIPGCRYRADDYTDDQPLDNPSAEGLEETNSEHAVREPRPTYRLSVHTGCQHH